MTANQDEPVDEAPRIQGSGCCEGWSNRGVVGSSIRTLHRRCARGRSGIDTLPMTTDGTDQDKPVDEAAYKDGQTSWNDAARQVAT
jgi:hypothetical protein